MVATETPNSFDHGLTNSPNACREPMAVIETKKMAATTYQP